MKMIARKRIFDIDEEWKLVRRLLPADWQGKAKELGAISRLRLIDSPEMLLRILLIHLADGCSLKETSLRVQQLGWGHISSVALFKRLRAAEQWLAWMAHQFHAKKHSLETTRTVLAVDATTVKEPGLTGSLWRVHWSVRLSDMQCTYFAVTDVHTGEKFSHYPIKSGQLLLADRGYSNPPGVDHVRGMGAHVLIRANPQSLLMFSRKSGDEIKILKWVKGLKIGRIRSRSAWVKGPEGRWHRGRLIAIKRSLASTRRELRRRTKNSRFKDRKPTRRTLAMARYVFVWTSLPGREASAKKVMEYYRARWQVELVFKRVKSIMGLGQLPKHSDASSRAWVNGKMLVALLVEKLWQKAEHFSPWGYGLPKLSKSLA